MDDNTLTRTNASEFRRIDVLSLAVENLREQKGDTETLVRLREEILKIETGAKQDA